MRRAAFGLLAIAALTAIDVQATSAESYRPWCVEYSGRDGARTCIFASFKQCMMTATPGTGGQCVQNPWYMHYGEHGQRQGADSRLRSKRQ